MSKAFDELKALLEKQGTLSNDEIQQAISTHGEITAEENSWLMAELHERSRAKEATVTMEQYLEAMKKLDELPEGSPEYAAAEKIVERFESAS